MRSCSGWSSCIVLVRAEFVHRTQRLFISSRGHHASRAQDFGNLHGQLTGDPRSAKNQDRFAGSQPGAVLERKPGGYAGVGNRRGGLVVQIGGHRKALRAPHHRALGHRAVRRPRPAEEYPRAVVQLSHSVRAANPWQFARARKVRAGGQLLVHRFQRCGADMYDHLALARARARGMVQTEAVFRERATQRHSWFVSLQAEMGHFRVCRR